MIPGMFAAAASVSGSHADPIIPFVQGHALPGWAYEYHIRIPATQAGDMILLLFAARRGAGSSWEIEAPAGFSTATWGTSGNFPWNCRVAYRVTSEAEPSHTVSLSHSSLFNLAIDVWIVRGATGDVVGDGYLPGSTSSLDPPSISTPWGDDGVLWIAGHGGNGTASPESWPSGFDRLQRAVASGENPVYGAPCRIISCATAAAGPAMDPSPIVMGSNSRPWVFTVGIRLGAQ